MFKSAAPFSRTQQKSNFDGEAQTVHGLTFRAEYRGSLLLICQARAFGFHSAGRCPMPAQINGAALAFGISQKKFRHKDYSRVQSAPGSPQKGNPSTAVP